MVILDACRNNPFEGKFRTARGSGLAQVDAPKGTLLAYATAPGKVASDGDGANGLYTAELLKAMEIPGAKVEEVFKAVRVNVIKATAGEQVPWESSSLTGDYYFRPAAAKADAAPASRETEGRQAELQANLEAERQAREKEALALKAEMEKLREEVRRLSVATASQAAPAAAEARAPVQAAKPPEAKSREEAKKPPDWPAPPGSKTEAAAKQASAAPPPGGLPPARPRESAAMEWKRRLLVLEGEGGRLTFAKAAAILLAPLSDEQLTVLVEKEKSLKDLPYHSALALGFDASGNVRSWIAWSERSIDFAIETVREKCSRISATPCAVVVVDGDFRQAAFLDWARHADASKLGKMRVAFLRVRAGRR
jgi:hypothetical protein